MTAGCKFDQDVCWSHADAAADEAAPGGGPPLAADAANPGGGPQLAAAAAAGANPGGGREMTVGVAVGVWASKLGLV